jgi:acetolactate synthase-1/3 small subunit
MLHTFVALVEDKPGVLTRVASLFRRLNINIVSLTVGESERPDTSRMTIVCDAHEHAAHRIRASLYKLETTVHVDEVDRSAAVVRELCLIKIAVGPDSPNGPHSRSQIFELANVFRARVVDPGGLSHRPHGHAARPPYQPRAIRVGKQAEGGWQWSRLQQ